MESQVIPVSVSSSLEKVIIGGDLAGLNPAQRVEHYVAVCQSMGLNPLTQPFGYIQLNGKLVLYAYKNCTDQLRRVHNVNVSITAREKVDDLYVVTAKAVLPGGRQDESIGAVCTGNLKGDSLANALMKAETKAKRRVTLSIVGLGMLDESEIETIPTAHTVTVTETGEVVEPPKSRSNKATPEAVKAWKTKEGDKYINVEGYRAHCEMLLLDKEQMLDGIDADKFELATYGPIEAMQRATDIADRKRTTQGQEAAK
ncbi:MAG: hypothetical protein WC683_08185 [bacterium]